MPIFCKDFFSDKFFYDVSHRLFCFDAKLLLAAVDLTTCYRFQSSVESILTKVSIFCDVCLRNSNCLSSFQKRFIVCV